MADVPWFKFYPSDWLGGTRGLEPAEVGIYINLLAMMYERGAPLSDDVGKLARHCGARKPAFEKALKVLLADGKIMRTKQGLWNDRVQKEIGNREERSSIAKTAAATRWGKREENQQIDNATATVEQCETDAIPEARSQKPEARDQKGDSESPPTRSKSPKIDDAEFDQFWRVYPRREAKGAARKAYERARKTITAEIIVEGAIRYARERAHEDPKYTKHPATWLNGECWGDEPRQPHIIPPGSGSAASPSQRPAHKTYVEQFMEMHQRGEFNHD